MNGDAISVILRDISMLEPGLVVIHVDGRGTSKLEELNSLINNHYGNDKQVLVMRHVTSLLIDIQVETTPFKVEVGVVCCAQYNEEWYRVKVISLDAENKVST